MITVMSFGFKYRRPPANNYVDVSFIRNPAREKNRTLFSVIDNEMISFIKNQPNVDKLIETAANFIQLLGECDDDVRFAFGCSSGRHRSPLVAVMVQENLLKKGIQCNIKHWELEDSNVREWK